MNDMERRKFEDSFQEAFKDAEVNPSENVWTNIALDLEKAESDKMKRRLIFFKTLAAASVTFAMVVAGVGYFMMRNDSTGNLASSDSKTRTEQLVTPDEKLPDAEKTQTDPATTKTTTDALGNSNNRNEVTADLKLEKENTQLAETADAADKTLHGKSSNDAPAGASTTEHLIPETAQESPLKNKATSPTGIAVKNKAAGEVSIHDVAARKNVGESNSSNGIVAVDNGNTMNGVSSSFDHVALNKKSRSSMWSDGASNRKLPAFYAPAIPTLKLPASNADPGMLLLAKLAEEEQRYARAEKNERKKQSEKLWTSVGFAAGGFSANNPSVSSPPSNSFYSMTSSNTASKQSRASGLAYSVGVSLGAKLSERWVVQGGLNYMTQMSDYIANSVVVTDNNFAAPKAESINAFSPQLSDASQARVAQTYPYNVNNSVRFVSFPVQAGYLVVNKKFGIQLNAGLSTDLFLQNTITPEGGGLASTTQSRGEASPYRSVNFSGLMGTEFSYRLGNRYRVALNPGLRYPFNSVYKENTGVNANPLTLDVGLRFRYIFQ